jgi:uncharacterized membrane protein YphA (DoxX/SURF4 family)
VTELGYLAALVLAGTFAWAGLAKLRAPAATRRTFRALGVPGPATAARVVPLAELGLAVGLVLVPGWAAAAALALLAAFSTLLLRAVRAGVEVSCGCFGSAGDQPVSFVELVRNALLGLAAVAALATPSPVAPSLAAVLVAGLGVALALVVLALADVRRRLGHLWGLGL